MCSPQTFCAGGTSCAKPVRTKYHLVIHGDTSFALALVCVEMRAKTCISRVQVKFDLVGRGVGANEVSGCVCGRRVCLIGGRCEKLGEMRFLEVLWVCSSNGTGVVIGDGRWLRGTSEGLREVEPFGVGGTKKKH